MGLITVPQRPLPLIGASATRSTTQSISNNTDTVITLTAEGYDTNDFYSTSVNASRMTIPAGYAGKYLVTAQVNFASNATGWRQVAIKLNGSAGFPTESRTPTVNGAGSYLVASRVLNLVAGDYVEISCYQNSGGALNAADGAALTISYLGA